MRLFMTIFLSAASVSDLIKRRISNKLILCSMVAGAYLSWHYGGFPSLADGVATAAAIFILFWPFFVAHLIGAGDIKLLMSVALISGHEALIQSLLPIMIFSIITLIIFSILNRGIRGVRVPMAVPLSLGILWTLRGLNG